MRVCALVVWSGYAVGLRKPVEDILSVRLSEQSGNRFSDGLMFYKAIKR